MTYYNKLRELRIDTDRTQAEIAQLLNISQTHYSIYELGKRALPIQHLRTLCIFYNVSSDYILGLPKGMLWPR